MEDPYRTQIATAELQELAGALAVVAAHADLNHRYRKLITDSQRLLATPRIRLTQARGIAKKLMVLAKAAGPDFRAHLPAPAAAEFAAGMSRADALVFGADQR
ncbi:hypothetical protein GCM10011581_33350 [Saccharopolyspora subtropica]|uniref:Uncharacterized protein n=1 Tax=Saccharopolyspora thermophila TaxID=89367 RepID=A0A917K235_9PSEU|nr:hypothetical protein [Saccharopolyspora subtropica]GGI93627.1 hypothetical protein GCM10011581_33350 [Saccharopolyspora subtropica]